MTSFSICCCWRMVARERELPDGEWELGVYGSGRGM